MRYIIPMLLLTITACHRPYYAVPVSDVRIQAQRGTWIIEDTVYQATVHKEGYRTDSTYYIAFSPDTSYKAALYIEFAHKPAGNGAYTLVAHAEKDNEAEVTSWQEGRQHFYVYDQEAQPDLEVTITNGKLSFRSTAMNMKQATWVGNITTRCSINVQE